MTNRLYQGQVFAVVILAHDNSPMLFYDFVIVACISADWNLLHTETIF